MNEKYDEKKTVTVIIDEDEYRQLESGARKRNLEPEEYLEILVETEYGRRNWREIRKKEISISKDHYDLLRKDARNKDLTVGQNAGLIIEFEADEFPKKFLLEEKAFFGENGRFSKKRDTDDEGKRNGSSLRIFVGEKRPVGKKRKWKGGKSFSFLPENLFGIKSK